MMILMMIIVKMKIRLMVVIIVESDFDADHCEEDHAHCDVFDVFKCGVRMCAVYMAVIVESLRRTS